MVKPIKSDFHLKFKFFSLSVQLPFLSLLVITHPCPLALLVVLLLLIDVVMSFYVACLHFCLSSPKTKKFCFDGSEAATEEKKQGRILFCEKIIEKKKKKVKKLLRFKIEREPRTRHSLSLSLFRISFAHFFSCSFSILLAIVNH